MSDIISTRVVRSEPVGVIPNAVNSEDFKPASGGEAIRIKYGWDSTVPVIGYAGSFVGYEGLDLLLRALGILRDRQVDFGAMFIGDGAKFKQLLALADELDLHDRVVFTGRIRHGEIARYYSAIDILAYPRRLTPATAAVSPMKPFEAMASGKAVLVSDVPALFEIAGGGERALVFKNGSSHELANALAAAIDHPEALDGIRARGKRWVESERDWKIVGSKFSRVLGDLMRSPLR